MTIPLLRPPDSVRAGPTPLMRLLAGEFAEATAQLWPEPHADFLAASAPRRHLAWMAMALERPVRADAVLRLPLKLAIALQLPQAPAGLRRALARMGETAWKAADYRELWRQLGRPSAAKVLRHLPELKPWHAHRLYYLPKPMHRVAIVAFAEPAVLDMILMAQAVIQRRDGGQAVAAAVARWGEAQDYEQLAVAMKRDLAGEPVDPKLPPSPALRWLGSKAAMREAARRFHNCLTTYEWEAAEGAYAFFEWLPAPGAILQLARDPVFGWTLVQARGHGNAAVGEPHSSEITAELRRLGVRVGAGMADLKRALDHGGLHWQDGYVFGQC